MFDREAKSMIFLILMCLTDGAFQYQFEAHIVSIFVSQSEFNVNLEVVKPALELAIRKAAEDYPHIKFNVVFRNGSSSCTANFAGVFAAEEYYLRHVTAFVGPACSLALDQVGRMAAYWNVPVYTAGGIDTKFADKSTFSTLTRVSFSLESTAYFIIQILKEFHWRHICVIVDDSDLQFLLLKASLVEATKNSPCDIYLTVKEFTGTSPASNYTKILRDGSTQARVFIILASGELVRNILLAAYDIKMGNGEYTFISIELIRESRETRDFSWHIGDDNKNKEARKIFEAFMIISVRVPTSPEYKRFVRKVVETSENEFGSTIEQTEVNPIVAAFYDCVLMYAWALNQTLAEGEDPNDGRLLARRLWNSTFQRGLTTPIFINDNGDREADYTLNDLDPVTGIMKPVAVYFGENKAYEKIRGASIHWPGGLQQPPPDIPYCGFMGDAMHCLNNVPFPLSAWIGIAVAALITLGMLIGFYLYRKIRFESTLSDLWWRIRWEDVTFLEGTAFDSVGSLHMVDDNNKKLSWSLHDSSTLQEVRVAGIDVGTYKGTKVAVKRFNIKKLMVNRSLLLEIKQMREITHENLVRFVGMCMDEPNIALFTEYSQRGSLQDILHNEAMKIDWIFRYAMMSDIVEGMAFLQNCIINHHGRLKSSNCVIDGRFVVKITDYGMNELFYQISTEQINPRKLFWTAPEHLRHPNPEKQGSKKGDIYSFAIILQEIITRSGPFERLVTKRNYLEPEEILQKVRMGTAPPFRPEVLPEDGPTEILQLMRMCWAEQPEDRLSFSEIKSQLKQITKGVTSKNFLDNLLSRMEQYANNLEELVEEKTKSLIDEKKKTDELLYQLLPKYIADELKKGCHVKPEAFESVTVFFSDIVGFTPLAAESTPMQVVNLLNDLYSCFDDIIEHYSVYKVETIGDAYMVVSGLPIRNGNEHAREIALMSLSVLRAIGKFKVRHRNERKLQVRIGIHSGPCAAGVVGLKMPRYCLFGDTVNTASRMESNGQPMKIHISSETKTILDIFGTFKITLRGDIQIKGKGVMRTFWLEGEKGDCHFVDD